MGTKKGGAEEAAVTTLGWIGETAGRMQGDETLEAEGRAAWRLGERTTYYMNAGADGGWKVQAEGASRATSVHKTKGEAIANAKELARGRPPSQLLVYKQGGTVHTEQTYG
ncbi:MAG TPA: DUF2188 domain-containing protein [Rubrobacter sp.]|nr:DUF2188 domain-containing protein [Rubrobacter sp.]